MKNREECCPIFDPGKALEMLENRSQNHQKSSNINPKVTKNRPNWCPGRSWRGSGEALGRSWGQDARKEGPKRFPDPPDCFFRGPLGDQKGAIFLFCAVFGAMFSRGQFLCRISEVQVAPNHPIMLSLLCVWYQTSLFARVPMISSAFQDGQFSGWSLHTFEHKAT